MQRGRIGETYNIGAHGEASNLSVIQLICELMETDGATGFAHVADRPGHDQRYAINPTKITTELGWTPEYTDLRAGLERTIDWYRTHESWWRDAKEAVENNYAKRGQ